MAIFSRPPRRKKRTESEGNTAEAQPTTLPSGEQPAEDNEPEDLEEINTPDIDEDKQEYDDRVIQKQIKKALDLMAVNGVVPTADQLHNGRTLMPKVCRDIYMR